MVNRSKRKKDGGLNLYRDRKMSFPEKPPEKCVGCPYGRWQDTTHYCLWVNCPKEKPPAEVVT
ncbi:hypothetical protein KCTCHS21_18720 [Cohnella abietis]|uniref:Uncharacterized protein n=1 Tax=Cohnella abietis TaxID=2507935 RepID=A0A3T1D2Y6_9BACL|nr:hypothetical protein KCTCHS21_18720 [Cohnella abietis]